MAVIHVKYMQIYVLFKFIEYDERQKHIYTGDKHKRKEV